MWDRSQQLISGKYLSQFYYRGVIRSSRVKLGGRISHTVDLIDPVLVHGRTAYTILIDETDRFTVEEDVSQ